VQRQLEKRKEIVRPAEEDKEPIVAKEISAKAIRMLMDRAKAYRKKGKNQRALADLTRVIESNPQQQTLGEAYFLRGLVYRQMDEKEKLQADWQEAQSLGLKLVEGESVRGKKQGLYTWYSPEGSMLSQATYVNDRLEGECVKFYPNGQMSHKGVYRAGKLEGPFSWYAPNGAKSEEGNFKNGLREGLFTKYNTSTGAVMKKINYSQGKVEEE